MPRTILYGTSPTPNGAGNVKSFPPQSNVAETSDVSLQPCVAKDCAGGTKDFAHDLPRRQAGEARYYTVLDEARGEVFDPELRPKGYPKRPSTGSGLWP